MLLHSTPAAVVDGTLYTLLAFSVVTWTLIFFKSWQFWRNSTWNNQFNESFWNADSLSDAGALPESAFKG
ncbi:MAG: MotA/TolQ/ExbB proton channel family protein, partial [Methyloglobulus sp.]